MSALNTNIINTSILVRVFLSTPTVGRSVATTAGVLLSTGFESTSVLYTGTIPLGMRYYFIGTELVCGYFDLAMMKFAFIGRHRGMNNTAKLQHEIGTVIRVASLYEIASTNIFTLRAGKSFLNTVPGVVLNRMGGSSAEDNPKVSDRLSYHVYGGQDENKTMMPELADMVHSALVDRATEAIDTQTNFGKIGNMTIESGQPLVFDKTRPEWPGVLCFGNVNAI